MMQLTSAIKNECSSNMSSYLWVTLIYISQKYYSVLTKMLILQNSVYTEKYYKKLHKNQIAQAFFVFFFLNGEQLLLI